MAAIITSTAEPHAATDLILSNYLGVNAPVFVSVAYLDNVDQVVVALVSLAFFFLVSS